MRPRRIALKYNAQPFELAQMKYLIWKQYRPYMIHHHVKYNREQSRYIYYLDMTY